ncbi:hypothetical protein I4U23_012929 [Adineta vaga]|nr:hypothetical protein I4U23_012929 [Adineta vaga]
MSSSSANFMLRYIFEISIYIRTRIRQLYGLYYNVDDSDSVIFVPNAYKDRDILQCDWDPNIVYYPHYAVDSRSQSSTSSSSLRNFCRQLLIIATGENISL